MNGFASGAQTMMRLYLLVVAAILVPVALSYGVD